MNILNIEECESEFLRAEDVGEILGIDPQCIRSQAQTDPRKLGFPVIVIGRKVHIPKQAFLHFCKYGPTIEEYETEFLRAEDVGEILGVDPQYIRSQAQSDPRKLGFPVIVIGRRVHIPKQAFLHFCKYGYGEPYQLTGNVFNQQSL